MARLNALPVVALPSRGSGEDGIAAVMTDDGDLEQGLRSVPALHPAHAHSSRSDSGTFGE